MQVDKPKPITQFLDDLRAAGQSIVLDSLIWIPDPANPGRLIAAVKVQPTPPPAHAGRLREDDLMLLVLAFIVVYLLYWSIRWVIGTAHFIWFDFWVGVYIDKNKRRTYWALLPCFVIIEEW